MRRLDEETYAWTGLDADGQPLSGKVQLAFEAGENRASLVLRSTVVDASGS